MKHKIQNKTSPISLFAKPSYQIRTIKTQIQDITTIPVDDQILKINGVELSENDRTLLDYQIENTGQDLWLCDARMKEIEIFRGWGSSSFLDCFYLEIPNWNVCALDIKKLLNKKFDYPLPMMKLTLNEEHKDFDDMRVQNFQKLTKNGNYICLSFHIPIHDMDGSNFSVEIKESDTVADLKSKIELLKKIPTNLQRAGSCKTE